MYASRCDNVDSKERRAKATAYLEALHARPTNTPFLSGAQLSLDDAAILPFVRQFASADRSRFDALALLPLARG